MIAIIMQCLLEAIFCCDAAADTAFTAYMAEEGIKMIPTICALLDASDPLSRCLRHKLILQEIMQISSTCLEVVST